MQRAGANHREVGRQGAELRDMLDASEQILEARISLVDHRRALLLRLADDCVDLVTTQRLAHLQEG